MTPSTFQKLSLEYFGGLLSQHGFEAKYLGNKFGPSYFRVNKNDIYHFIRPQTNRYGDWFDIMVFGNSPHINAEFEESFENGMDVPSDVCSFLHPKLGVHWRQKTYKCKSEDDFLESYTKEALPALLELGIPYLNKIVTVSDLIKTVHPQVAHSYILTGG